MVEFVPEGTYEEAVALHRQDRAAVDKAAARHPGMTFDSIGVSTEKALDKEIQGGLAKAGMISIPLTIIILMIVLGAFVGVADPAARRPHVRRWQRSASSRSRARASPPARTSWK